MDSQQKMEEGKGGGEGPRGVTIATLGLYEQDVRELVDGAVKELRDPCTRYAMKFHHVFATKRVPALD